MPMASRLGMIMTYLERLLPIKPHDDIITCLAKLRGKLKSIYIYYHKVYGFHLWLPDLTGWRYTSRSFLPQSNKVLQLCRFLGHVKS